MEDLNGWVGDRVRDNITGELRVPFEDENGKGEVYFCSEKGDVEVKVSE